MIGSDFGECRENEDVTVPTDQTVSDLCFSQGNLSFL